MSQLCPNALNYSEKTREAFILEAVSGTGVRRCKTVGQMGGPSQSCPGGVQGGPGPGLGSSLVLLQERRVAGSRDPGPGRLGAAAGA